MKTLITVVMLVVSVASSPLFANPPAPLAAAPPLLVIGDPCAAGSVKHYPWKVYEDRNGDGTYDWVVIGNCDGLVTGGPFLSIGTTETYGQSPDVGATHHEFSNTLEPSGLYSWTLVELLDSDLSIVCTIERDSFQTLSCSCQPPLGGELE